MIWRATPVCGAWQLQFMVHNFAPAVQKVVVEQQADDGSWRELASRFTIEFRAYAARPHTRIKREFTVPVEMGPNMRGSAVAIRALCKTTRRHEAMADKEGTPPPGLRIAVRGVGQVAISHVQLTNGVETWQAHRNARRLIKLGQPAPRRGLPVVDWSQNSGPVIML
jgi:hypothetical protein